MHNTFVQIHYKKCSTGVNESRIEDVLREHIFESSEPSLYMKVCEECGEVTLSVN